MAKKNCEFCGELFYVRPSKIHEVKYCVRTCKDHAWTASHTIDKICPICGKGFRQRLHRSKQVKGASCCSRTCASQLRLGKNSRPGYLKHHLDEAEIERLYVEEKMAPYMIGERFNVAHQTITDRLKKRGVQLRTLGEAIKLTVKKGSDCHWWKGGKRKDHNGYIVIRDPGHRLANVGGYVKEHHLAWEKANGKELPKGWIVHHLNGIRDDNRPENLVALDRHIHTERENGLIAKRRIKQLEQEVKRLKSLLGPEQSAIFH